MGEIIVQLVIRKPVAIANGAALQIIQDWIKTNIVDKLPADAQINIRYAINP